MPKNLPFWSNVALIAVAHVVIIVGLIRWSRESKDWNAPSVVWMNGGSGDGVVLEKRNPPAPAKSPPSRKESKTEPFKERESEEDPPLLASAPSEIQLPLAKPSSTSTATPALTPKAKPKETPTASPARTATPKPKPRSTAKATPKSSPKKLTLAKASPRASPKLKSTPEENDQADEKPAANLEKTETESVKSEVAQPVPTKKSVATQTGSGKGTAPGAGGGRAGGSATESQFGWYGSMLHDRFYSEWVQPTTVSAIGTKNSVLVKLRIEKDGRVSSFEVVRPSGNVELDESVQALANRVSRVDPLPDGLGKGDHYDVKINFELNSE
jgi:periplasmic protein TonB